ncbi:MAG TPA: AmmeMemoRadiSam system protein A [Pyrinomonadaceae bacterium]|jgi:AmmeMemoRadiSam system protein A/AmmeMemoRadiSam system protein B
MRLFPTRFEMTASYLVFTGIAPHPPIMVPEVGQEAAGEVRASIDAMREFTRRLIESGAETVVLVSPHAPLEPTAFVAYEDAQLYGDFRNFRAPGTRVEAPLDEELLNAIRRTARAHDYKVSAVSGYELDHGTSVPLYFLLRNGWQGRVVALGYTFLSNEDHLRFGSCIKSAIEETARPAALVASGDLSHRLKPGAPAGFNPEAHLFDEEVVASLRVCDPSRIVKIDQGLRKRAGECGYRSMLIAFGAAQSAEPTCEVLSYEAPFGVGYMVAQVSSRKGAAQAESMVEEATETESEVKKQIIGLARSTIEAYVSGVEIPKASADLLPERAACFVSIKTDEGELRGCIGTIEPSQDSLAEEIIANAISAATRDPRFPPVSADELSHLRYSVDVLYEPEPATFDDLDPKVYGVIVEDAGGTRRGLLLPDIEGVKTASQQVEIAARKAGIRPGTPLKLSRFRVERFSEMKD